MVEPCLLSFIIFTKLYISKKLEIECRSCTHIIWHVPYSKYYYITLNKR